MHFQICGQHLTYWIVIKMEWLITRSFNLCWETWESSWAMNWLMVWWRKPAKQVKFLEIIHWFNDNESVAKAIKMKLNVGGCFNEKIMKKACVIIFNSIKIPSRFLKRFYNLERNFAVVNVEIEQWHCTL